MITSNYPAAFTFLDLIISVWLDPHNVTDKSGPQVPPPIRSLHQRISVPIEIAPLSLPFPCEPDYCKLETQTEIAGVTQQIWRHLQTEKQIPRFFVLLNYKLQHPVNLDINFRAHKNNFPITPECWEATAAEQAAMGSQAWACLLHLHFVFLLLSRTYLIKRVLWQEVASMGSGAAAAVAPAASSETVQLPSRSVSL
ncbi:uncharacterized protein LOC125461233 isoform X2 [Stegostoma tigrinum]|uniref:uncharacterized protein LOC125461233 isoform X2 n=1 Tax=Stegostoma tigrinum TaxID=3053191 RepID=UPI00202B6F9F|nr:uncharacterized protein LOC125461233 isoform X2 [Stegostoma tigrinum]